LIGGTVDIGSSVAVTVDTAATVGPVTVNLDGTWNVQISGLVSGTNNISVTAKGTTTVSTSINIDLISPTLTINAVTTPTVNGAQTISGTVDPGVLLLASANTSATVSPFTLSGGNWSAQVSGFTPGANAIGVAAVDAAGNFAFRMVTIYFSTTLTISDALKALKISVNLTEPTTPYMNLLDVSPLVGGVPSQSGSIDIADSLLVLRKVVGLVDF
jgi:hypothetical protein